MELLWILLQAPENQGNHKSGLLMMIGMVFLIILIIKKSKSQSTDVLQYSNNQIKETVNQNNMSQEIKCPQCGGNKVEWTGGTCKCMYCGTMFQPIVETPKQEQPVQLEPTISQAPATPSSNVNVTVNVPNAGGGYDNRRSDNSFSKGAAQGAGVAAGGCLTTTAIILAIPFILFLALLSMCS